MSLPLRWREWAIPLMRYGERFSELGHTGQSNATLLSHGDEDDRASECEALAFAPALGERRHCSLARRFVAVRRRAVVLVPEALAKTV
jgi:hypothetical protein